MISTYKNMLGITNKIQLDIGGLNDGVGISQRQLHYWEEKGYAKPVADSEKGVRRYSFFMVSRCTQIKESLDEDYTLTRAYEKTIKDEQKKKIFRDFTFNQGGNFTINVTDKEHSYGEIDLNARCESKELFGIVDKNDAGCELR